MQNDYIFEDEQNSLIPEGDYEAKIERIEVKTTSTGKEKLSIMYRIRNDIDGQSYGNKCLFEDIWKERENPAVFNRKRINMLLGTQHLTPGTMFKGIGEVIECLLGSCVVLHVVQSYDDYREEDVNRIAWYKRSNQTPKSLGESQSSAIVSDDDLPF